MVKKLFLFGILTLFMLGIAAEKYAWCWQTHWSPEYREKVTTRIYNMSPYKIFDIVSSYCEKNGYTIIIRNKESGVVVTDYTIVEDIHPGMGRAKLEFNIFKQGVDSSKVQLDIRFRRYPGYGIVEDEDSEIGEDHYKDIFDRITDAVESLKQPDSAK